MERFNVSVIGAGAVGTFYGSKLQKWGLNIEYFSRSYNGIYEFFIKSKWGDYKLPLKFFDSTYKMKKSDLILITLKALPEISVYDLIKPIIKDNSIILFLQNGINQEEKFKEKAGKDIIILGGLAFTCINRVSKYEVHHLDYGNIKIGSLEKRHRNIAKQVVEIFNQASIPAEFVKNLRKARWEKLLWNIAFNTLSVIGNYADTKELIGSYHSQYLARKLMKEILKIAEFEDLLPGKKKKIIQMMMERTQKMEPYRTSMLLDYQNKLPMEIEAIVGEPLRLAQKYKIDTPYLEFCYYILKFLENKNINIKV